MNALRNLFRRWAATQRPAPLASSQALPYTRLTLDDWRSSAERTAYAAELLRTPLFLDLVGMLANVRPPECRSLDSTAAAVMLGERIGHDQIIATLLEAARPLASAPADVAADYAPENVMARWENDADA